MDMVERVALAMERAALEYGRVLKSGDAPRALTTVMAIAAIKAMRDPTAEMEAAGQATYMYGVNHVNGVAEASDEAAYQLYRLMIDAALTPTQRETQGAGDRE